MKLGIYNYRDYKDFVNNLNVIDSLPHISSFEFESTIEIILLLEYLIFIWLSTLNRVMMS